MNDATALFPGQREKPPLPLPTQPRWQPLRLGLLELFHYDSEEFWFRDGHLLLRGNNGTGKSKVLSLTLPFLLDAQLKPSRIEPDGDSSKKMAWNLLVGRYDRRIGYAWIEFGRIAEDGTPRYLSLGAGLSAAAARPQVDSWFFVLDDPDGAARINQDFWLMSPQRVVLTKERLRDALEDRGQVFDTAANYRRAVDERLFHLGAKRYDALMDTLIQLRQPQLSKKPDETALSNALTEALPPIAPELLGDVAEALGQLEEDRRQLEEYQTLAKAIGQFVERYRIYAGTQSRRQARALRQAQTKFDNASRAPKLKPGWRMQQARKQVPKQLRMKRSLPWRASAPVMTPCRRARRCRTPTAWKARPRMPKLERARGKPRLRWSRRPLGACAAPPKNQILPGNAWDRPSASGPICVGIAWPVQNGRGSAAFTAAIRSPRSPPTHWSN